MHCKSNRLFLSRKGQFSPTGQSLSHLSTRWDLFQPVGPNQFWVIGLYWTVFKLLKSSKMSYYASLINENKSDSKVLFNTTDRMLHRTPQNHYPSCGSPKELCDKFADFSVTKL